ncbi:MAG TPA: hypothetical protein VNA17_04950 [Pyrinomonadaceae bacterium]|nr:hypothetical protein [Pyrinomonadaceae bacterium]
MPSTSITFGILLILIGVAGYLYGLSTGGGSLTALIPAAFGGVLAVLGWAARGNEGLRKHLMHVAVVVALLGFLATAGRLAMKAGEITLSAAFLSQLATALVCLVFIILAVRSFVAARSRS